MTARPTATKPTAARVAPVIAILLALLFLFAGGTKLTGSTAAEFAGWGYPAWFQYLIGGVEVLAGGGFLWSRTRFLAAAVVVPIMAGAIFTVVRAGTAVEAVAPAVTLLLALFVAKASRRA